MKRSLNILPLVLITILALSCQSPMETPPTTTRSVTVHVQDGSENPLPFIPVVMLEPGDAPGELRDVESRVTDRSGNAAFSVTIPTTGRAFVFVVGDDNTGRVQLEADLLCRDTVMVVQLQSEELPCRGSADYTIRFDDVCAPLSDGSRLRDEDAVTFRSTCDVPMSMTMQGPENSRDIAISLFAADGSPIPGLPFTLEALGFFTVRVSVSPPDSSLHVYRYTFTGTGAAGASLELNLTVEVEGRNCNTCLCPDSVIVLDFGVVQADRGQTYSKTLQALMPLNSCLFTRIDNHVGGPTRPISFRVTAPRNQVVETGETSLVSVVFSPLLPVQYEDTVYIAHDIPDENRQCTTMVVLRGAGCGPECTLVEDNLTGGPAEFGLDMGRVRVYEGTGEGVCFRNTGECGTVTVSAASTQLPPGFSLEPRQLEIGPGELGCFTVRFDAAEDVVWPAGHGQPAVVDHTMPVFLTGCGSGRRIDVRVQVDTLPALFSRCVYRWDQNEHFGYNFTPVQGKGEDRLDPDPFGRQLSDLVVQSVLAPVTADVLVRSGWKFIKGNVSEDEFNFTDMSAAQNGWSRSEYLDITTGAFSSSQAATLLFRAVYSLRVERDGVITYACVRVREVSVDPDGKYKVCFDVMYPMIQE